MSRITVKFAVYGALNGGDANSAQAADVKSSLQSAIDLMDGTVTINNTNMGGDSSRKNKKSFGAIITRDGGDYYYACQEGQKIDFQHGGK